jgi:2-dehydropantoate 2-reductase
MDAVHIVGAGGIGCAVGHALRAAGAPVVFVDIDRAKVEWGRQHGVRVGHGPAFSASFEHFTDWAPPPGATVFLCTKCYDNAAVLDRLRGRAAPIPIQNGFDPALAPPSQSPEGIASFVSECDPHRTRTRLTRQGRLHFGYRGSTRQVMFPEAVLLMQRAAPFSVQLVEDILPYKYTKLMYNAAISPLAAAAGLDNGRLLSVPKARRLFFALLRENYAILHAAGVQLGKIGPFHPDTVSRILRRAVLANALAWAFYPTLRGTYCSMSGDLPAGRTEIDYYNRHLIDIAGDGPCPLNRRVYRLIKRMEQERIPPSLGALDDLL